MKVNAPPPVAAAPTSKTPGSTAAGRELALTGDDRGPSHHLVTVWRTCTCRPIRNHMVTTPQHWHVWRMASTGRAAFMGRAFLTRAAARKAAERWAGQYRRALTFVHECSLAECPRPPRRELDVQP